MKTIFMQLRRDKNCIELRDKKSMESQEYVWTALNKESVGSATKRD